jgi:Heavy metal binding domain
MRSAHRGEHPVGAAIVSQAVMVQTTPPHGFYCCPMHPRVHYRHPGTCPYCGMELRPEGTWFAMLRQIIGNPTHMVIMAALMAGVMAAAMMLMR